MGFQGQLGSSVSLTDIFQTLQMNRQSGTLVVTGSETIQKIYFQEGFIVLVGAPEVDGLPFVLSALVRRAGLDPDDAYRLMQSAAADHSSLRDVIRGSGMIEDVTLDEVVSWCVEELVCPIFDWREGEFVFSDGGPSADLSGLGVVELAVGSMQATALLLEASRRNDEWQRIRDVIPEFNAVFIAADGADELLNSMSNDPDLSAVMQAMDGRHTLDEVARLSGVSRFDTFAIAAQLVLSGAIRARSPEEVLDEAQMLRQSGDMSTACQLLEATLASHHVPEVLRPLAELHTELKHSPRAVELYLELIQIDQDQGNLDQALADLDTVLRISPDDPDLQVDRAKVLGELGRLDESAVAFTAAAQALLVTRDVPRAIDACHRAKNLLPRSPDPHRYLAKAYLLDGQTDSALVEYKALWHALLSQERPQRALDLFKGILDSDCRFGGIKQQALDHAQNSEAVKTSQATRMLIYVACGLVLVVAVFVSIQFYQDTVVKDKGRGRLAVFKNNMPARLNAGEHIALLDELAEMRKTYASFDVISEDVDRQAAAVRADFETRADTALQAANTLLAAAKFDQARAAYENLCARYPDTRAAHSAQTQIDQVRLGAINAQVEGILKDAQARWTNFDWDVALATVKPLAERKELPAEMKARVTTIIADWQGKLADSTALTGRADAMVRAGRRKDALDGYRRAIAAGGIGVAQATDRLTTLELTLARELVAQAQDAFARDDDRSAFRTLDELAAIVKVSTSKDLRRYVDGLGLPFVVKVDSPLTTLAIRRATGGEQFVRAPANTTGPWMYRLLYTPSETVSIEARHTGFTPQTVVVNYQGRRSSAGITLARGPLWRAELEGTPVATPVMGGKAVLVATDRSNIEVIDPSLGGHRPISLPQSVDEFRASPMVAQGNAWTVLDHRLWGIDLVTRTPIVTWPTLQMDTRQRLDGSLWVQEHELIPGQILTFLGGVNGVVMVQAVDRGRVIPYPAVNVGGDITGGMTGAVLEPGRTLLFVPVGNQVLVFDTTTATEHMAMVPLYTARTRGDIVGTLVPAQVADRRAVLALDASGLLVALGVVSAEAGEDQRAIGSWVLDGTGVDRAAVMGNRAVVALSEGKVVAVDLAHPGQVLWRFPDQGSLGALAGAPAIGKGGVYVADANGTLHCLDVNSGAEKWRADLGSPVRTGILAHDGRVYVPTRNGVVACFEEGDE